MDNFKFVKTNFDDLFVVERNPIHDSRGFFDKLFCSEDFSTYFDSSIKQINLSKTNKIGTLRGLHFQKYPFIEKKFVSCIRGKIFDVVVDIRKNSPTFLMHYSTVLSSDSSHSLLIPEGFAHGFQSIEENSKILYMHSENYQPKFESGLNCLDPILKIDWPLPVSERSERDKEFSFISKDFLGLDINEM
jgi:dTDP-4-dehydrorhamnose 3,5-epimerase